MKLRELLEIIRSARDLLADRSRWSPVYIATDENGRWVPVGKDDATRFNLQGAVIRAAGHRARDTLRAAESGLRMCSSETFAKTLTWPRPMTYEEALEWLDTAISRLASQAGIEDPATSRSSESGLMLRVSEAEAMARRRTTGTDDGEE